MALWNFLKLINNSQKEKLPIEYIAQDGSFFCDPEQNKSGYSYF